MTIGPQDTAVTAEARLAAALARHGPLAVAVSGGVDSMLLMHAAHGLAAGTVAMHAVSPAVPEEATARVRRHAARAALTLRLLGAPNRDLTVAVPVLTGLIAVSLISHGLWQSWWIGTIGLVAAATSAVLGTPPNPGVAGDGTTA